MFPLCPQSQALGSQIPNHQGAGVQGAYHIKASCRQSWSSFLRVRPDRYRTIAQVCPRRRRRRAMLYDLTDDIWERICALSIGAEFVKLLMGSTSKYFFNFFDLLLDQGSTRLTYKSVARAAFAEHQRRYVGSPQGNLAAPVIGGKKVPVTTSKEVLAEPPFGKAFVWVRDHVASASGTRHGDALHRLHLLVCDHDGKKKEAAVRWLVDIVADCVVAKAEADPAVGEKRRLALANVASGSAQAASGPSALGLLG